MVVSFTKTLSSRSHGMVHVEIFHISFLVQDKACGGAHHQPQQEEQPDALALAPVGGHALEAGEARARLDIPHRGLPAGSTAQYSHSAIGEAENGEENRDDEDCHSSGNKASYCHCVSEMSMSLI